MSVLSCSASTDDMRFSLRPASWSSLGLCLVRDYGHAPRVKLARPGRRDYRAMLSIAHLTPTHTPESVISGWTSSAHCSYFPEMHGLEGYVITEQVEDEEGIHLTAKIPGEPADCDKCGGKWNSNGTRSVVIRDVNIGTKMVGVQVIRQRYICRECKQCGIQTMPHIHEGHLMTTRLVDFIKSESAKYPFLAVANKIGIDEGTVSAIHQESVKLRIAELGISTPRYMGLDEIHLGDTDMAVITNLEASTVYDIRPGRTAKELGQFFKELPDRDKVEAIVIDDWKAYRKIIREWFSCPIVVDKAHLIFRAGQAMEAARKAVRSPLKRSERHLMKSDRSLLPKREFEEAWQAEALNKMLADFPVLAECRAPKPT